VDSVGNGVIGAGVVHVSVGNGVGIGYEVVGGKNGDQPSVALVPQLAPKSAESDRPKFPSPLVIESPSYSKIHSAPPSP